MKITYDKTADAIYIYLLPEPKDSWGIVDETTGLWPFHFDYTKDGKLFGIEVMDASFIFSKKFLNSLKKSQPLTKTFIHIMIKELKLLKGRYSEKQKLVSQLIKALENVQKK